MRLLAVSTALSLRIERINAAMYFRLGHDSLISSVCLQEEWERQGIALRGPGRGLDILSFF